MNSCSCRIRTKANSDDTLSMFYETTDKSIAVARVISGKSGKLYGNICCGLVKSFRSIDCFVSDPLIVVKLVSSVWLWMQGVDGSNENCILCMLRTWGLTNIHEFADSCILLRFRWLSMAEAISAAVVLIQQRIIIIHTCSFFKYIAKKKQPEI